MTWFTCKPKPRRRRCETGLRCRAPFESGIFEYGIFDYGQSCYTLRALPKSIQPPSRSHRPMNLRITSLACVFLFCCTAVVADDFDWPQWRGPDRDGKAAEQKLLRQWPEGGPPLKWSFRNAGRGYSAVSIAGGRVYTMGARDGVCYALCLDADSGELVWETEISRAGTGEDYNDGWGAGPRSTPTAHGDQVFVLSDVGTVAALGKRRRRRPVVR